MARIEGVDLPRNKPIFVALTYIYGIGRTTALKILEEAGIDRMTRVFQLSDHEVARIREIIQDRIRVEASRTESATPPRASPSALVRITPVRSSVAPKARAAFTAS